MPKSVTPAAQPVDVTSQLVALRFDLVKTQLQELQKLLKQQKPPNRPGPLDFLQDPNVQQAIANALKQSTLRQMPSGALVANLSPNVAGQFGSSLQRVAYDYLVRAALNDSAGRSIQNTIRDFQRNARADPVGVLILKDALLLVGAGLVVRGSVALYSTRKGSFLDDSVAQAVMQSLRPDQILKIGGVTVRSEKLTFNPGSQGQPGSQSTSSGRSVGSGLNFDWQTAQGTKDSFQIAVNASGPRAQVVDGSFRLDLGQSSVTVGKAGQTLTLGYRMNFNSLGQLSVEVTESGGKPDAISLGLTGTNSIVNVNVTKNAKETKGLLQLTWRF